MKRNVFLIVGIVILAALGSNVFADTIYVVYLNNGSIVRGTVVEIIPDETIKIETVDDIIIVYPFDEVQKITKETDKSSTIRLKDPYEAMSIQIITGVFLSGGGQIYNGQYLTALVFGSMHS